MPISDELLKAVKLIKAVCENNDRCEKCPLRGDYTCVVSKDENFIPEDWTTEELEVRHG